MYEQILKIILSVDRDDVSPAADAKEIAEMMKEFIEWKDKHTGLPNKSGMYLYWEDHYSICTLFDYWFKNVKQK